MKCLGHETIVDETTDQWLQSQFQGHVKQMELNLSCLDFCCINRSQVQFATCSTCSWRRLAWVLCWSVPSSTTFLGLPPCDALSPPATFFATTGLPLHQWSLDVFVLGSGRDPRAAQRRLRAPLPSLRRGHDPDQTSSSSTGWPAGPGSGGDSAPSPS